MNTMTKAEASAKFAVGKRVVLSRARHADYIGLCGIVQKYIKCRHAVRVLLDRRTGHCDTYDANPENLDEV